MRIVRMGLLVVPALALLGGCVIDPFDLPSIGTSGSAGSVAPGYGYGTYGYGSGYGSYDPRYGAYDPRYGAYDPRFGYHSYRYDPRLGYATPGYPYYYGPGTGYYPYPGGPYCRDANRDGRCDSRPPDDDDDSPGAGDGGGPNQGRDGLGRNPIERLRDVGRPAPAGAAGRAPVTNAPLQQPSGVAPGATARPPGISQLPRASQRSPVAAPPPRARPEPARDRPPPAVRSVREADGGAGAARRADPAKTVER
jgi:hypothetical protein